MVPPALMVVVFGAAGLGFGWVFLYRQTGQIVDQLALMGAQSYSHATPQGVLANVYALITSVTSFAVHLVGWPYIVGVIAVIVALTVWQRKWWQGLGAIVAFTGANLTTQMVKAWWTRPDFGLYTTYGNSWPSGHTTLAAAAMFAFLLMVPAGWRWVLSLAAALVVTATAWGTVFSGWHRPSDTVGAICVAAFWYVLVEATRRSLVPVPVGERVNNRKTKRLHDVAAGILAAIGIGIFAALVLALPDGPVHSVDRAVQRVAFAGALCGIAATAIVTSRLLLVVGPREVEPHN